MLSCIYVLRSLALCKVESVPLYVCTNLFAHSAPPGYHDFNRIFHSKIIFIYINFASDALKQENNHLAIYFCILIYRFYYVHQYIRPRNINSQDWKYIHRSQFSSGTVKTYDVTMQTLQRTSSKTSFTKLIFNPFRFTQITQGTRRIISLA